MPTTRRAHWFTLALAVVSVALGAPALALSGTPVADVVLASFIGTVLVVWAIELAEHVTFSNPAP